jgi:hypothetical protein
VIPASWTPHHRTDDAELLGYLRPIEESAGRYVPVTVFGSPLAGDCDEADAQQVLESVGLGYLAGRWLLTLAQYPEPISVEIVEAGPDRVRVQNVDFSYGDYGQVFVLEAPVDSSLRRA